MQKITSLLVNVLTVPLIILNLFGGIVSGIWLIFLGEWSVLLWGVFIMAFGAFVIGLLLMISLIFAAPLVYFAKKKILIGIYIFAFLSMLATYYIFIVASQFIYVFLAESYTDASIWPLIIWAFSVAVAPWSYMASKEQDNDSTQLTLFICQSTLLFVSFLLITGVATVDAFGTGFWILFIAALITAGIAVSSIKNGGDTLIRTGGFEKSMFSDEELQVYVLTLVWIAASDNKLKTAEVLEIRDKFKKISGESISKKLIRNIFNNSKDNKISLDDIQDSTSNVSKKMKEIILKSSYDIAKSDSDLAKSEISNVLRLAKVLGYTKAEALEILDFN